MAHITYNILFKLLLDAINMKVLPLFLVSYFLFSYQINKITANTENIEKLDITFLNEIVFNSKIMITFK